ncbi:RNA-directed DNA polymerase, eukaryota [Tanacetum coccineum]
MVVSTPPWICSRQWKPYIKIPISQGNAGLFSGIPIDSSLTLSHIFFVDDAIFVGKWDSLNIRTIVNVFKCFHLASGLKINFHKSKLMGIGTRPEEVDATATTMGCSIFTTPFVHLGVKTQAEHLEGNSLSDYLLSDLELLKKRFIKAICGEDGALNSPSSLSKCSSWLDIICEVTILLTKGINRLDLIRKKVGNGLNTLFWEDPWLDDLALKHKFSRLYALDNYKQIIVVEKINHASMVDTFRRPPRGGAKEEQLGFLLSRMDGLILTKIPDRWVWSLKAKVRLDKLPTRLNLSLKGIDISTIVCPLCHASVESGSHIFFSCPMARQLWRKLMRWWELEDIDLVSYED